MSNALQLTRAALTTPTDLKGMFEVEAFRHNFMSNYEKTTGQKNGSMIFERERILFMKAIAENKKLEQCDRFTIYAAFIELAVSGLTLNEGICYIIPYKDRAQMQIGWRGRLEQISQMPEINYVPEPQVVLTNELCDFDYELGETPRIVKHKPAKDRTITKENRIEYVYLILDTKFGKRTFLMSRQEVLQIRDTYSIGYKQYMSKGGKWPDGNPMEPPFWLTNEAEAFKKTLVKRAYKYLPKTPRMKAIDEKIKTYIDHEDGTSEETHDIDYGLAADQKALPGNSGAVQSSSGGNSAGTVSERVEGKAQGAGTTDNGAAPKEEKSKRSHKKKAEQTIATPAEQAENVITTASGAQVDTSTGEEINPAANLPELNDLDSY